MYITLPCCFDILGRPSQPLLSIKGLKEKAVRVGWNSPFNGGRDITDYIIDVKKIYGKHNQIDHLLRMNISNHEACILIVTPITDPWSSAIRSWVKSTDATVINLRPTTTYNLRLFAVNSVGTSDASNVLTFTTKEAGKIIQWHECEVSSKGFFFFTSCHNETVLNTFIPSVCKD